MPNIIDGDISLRQLIQNQLDSFHDFKDLYNCDDFELNFIETVKKAR